MDLSEFDYQLPRELIAEFPAQKRSDSRLLCLETTSGRIEHRVFSDLLDYLCKDDLLVFNDTRVIPARLQGRKESGGQVEVLIERVLADNRVLAQVRASKSPAAGTRLWIQAAAAEDADATDGLCLEVMGRQGEFFLLQFPEEADLQKLLRRYGHMPLPPYIRRGDESLDFERYQTVYASRDGAVAAPTAGLHFDQEMLERIRRKGIGQAFVTLHVGAGTFQPVRVAVIEQHRMHKEWIDVSALTCQQVMDCKRRGGRVIAVGTTSVRSLEAAAQSGKLAPYQGDTEIFIYPGYEFRVVDAILTNFHLPQSTLLMLVSAFCGKKMLLDAYEEAIAQRYRFFSYGDAMLVYKKRE